MRWSEKHNKRVDCPRVERFLDALKELSKEHGLCLCSRYVQGGFAVETYDKFWADELECASVGASVTEDINA